MKLVAHSAYGLTVPSGRKRQTAPAAVGPLSQTLRRTNPHRGWLIEKTTSHLVGGKGNGNGT